MNEEQLRAAVIELLYDLHSITELNEYILNSITRNFKIDAYELCEQYGITYNIE
jgi:hypothetical protein